MSDDRIRELEDACLVLWAEISVEDAKTIQTEYPRLADFLGHLHRSIEHEQAMVRRNVWAERAGEDHGSPTEVDAAVERSFSLRLDCGHNVTHKGRAPRTGDPWWCPHGHFSRGVSDIFETTPPAPDRDHSADFTSPLGDPLTDDEWRAFAEGAGFDPDGPTGSPRKPDSD